jgi:glycosyltransferase involved in cell wall biosynthesis
MLPTISIAAPAYQEGGHIRALAGEWLAWLEKRFRPGDYEVVICDDGSRDQTWDELSALAKINPALKPCRHAANQGAAAALTTAIRHTTKDWVLLLDTDGQYPIENLEAFIRAGELSPARAYIGFRPHKADSPFARFGSWASGACCNFFHGSRYRDFNCALKLVEGPLLRDLELEAKGLNYSTEISSRILERGVEMREVEIVHRPRAGGRSSRTLLRGSLHRFLFVFYIGVRQLLLRWGILQRRAVAPS